MNRFFLHGIAYYGLEARCLPGLITVIKHAKVDRQVEASIFKRFPDQCKTDITLQPTLSTKYLRDSTKMHWFRLQKAISPELRASLYAHRKLLLGDGHFSSSVEDVLDALTLDYLMDVYGCIDEDDADLSNLVHFTALCEQLTIGKLSMLVLALSEVTIVPQQLKQAYYKLMHKLATDVCNLQSFPSDVSESNRSSVWVLVSVSLRADIIQLVLHYLGFTTEVIVDNLLAGLPADTLTEEAHDSVDLALLCPLNSELESSSSASAATGTVRLTAAARATRMQLFEQFVLKWRKALHRDSLSDDVQYLFDRSTTSTSFELLIYIERLNYYQAKVTEILPLAPVPYKLPAHVADKLSSSLDVVIASSEQSVSVQPAMPCDYVGCWALADEIQRELSTSYLKNAIRVRASVVKTKHCIVFEKLYAEYERLGRTLALHIRERLIGYANEKLLTLSSKHDQARLEALRIFSSDAYKNFRKGITFPLASFQITVIPEPSSPLSTPSGPRSYVQGAITYAEQQNPQLHHQDSSVPGQKRPALTVAIGDPLLTTTTPVTVGVIPVLEGQVAKRIRSDEGR